MANSTESTARAHCYVCDKVKRLCLCGRIAQVENRTPVHVVQHRNESRHPFGSIRIARLGLSNMSLDVVRDEHEPLQLPEDAVVLYPDPGAPVLSELAPADRPRRLVVVDGTWALASQLRRHHPALKDLPAVTLPKGPPSRYRLRSEPTPEAISSLEAIVRALRILEPETAGFDGLIDAFDALNEDQLELRSRRPATPRHRKKPRVKKPPPAALLGDPARLVLVYAELHRPRGQDKRSIVRLTASRPTVGLLLDVLMECPLPVSPLRLDNMRLPADASIPTVTPTELAARLADVLEPSDTLVSWSVGPEASLRELGLEHPFLSAKHQFGCQFMRGGDGKVGALAEVVQRLGLTTAESLAPGRGGRQLALMEAVVRAMRQRATSDAAHA